jgi:ARG/rhodanese/phosphatase superfamily protein
MIRDLIQLGEPVEHRGIVVAPVFPKRDPVARYVTLDDALALGLRISETSESGSVPELVVENPLDERVLLYDGEELLGAKQNRILNVSVLVAARSKLTIPVSCVEQGRWSRRSDGFTAAPQAASPDLRHRKNLALELQPLARGASQGEVWDAVRDKAARMSVHSMTGASHDTYRAYERDIRALEDAFPAQHGQCGAVLGLGSTVCLDAVSRPDAFARLWPKLRAGYLLDAVERLDASPTAPAALGDFLEAVATSVPTHRPSAGLGLDVRLRGDGVLGSGLELEAELIQLSAFRAEGAGRPPRRIARPSRRS